MKLNINQSYQKIRFGMKDFGLKKKLKRILGITAVGAGAGTVAKDTLSNNGVSMEELNGRVLVTKNSAHPNFFNQEVSFNYFANGKLKDVPEYIEAGKEAISNLKAEDKENHLNLLAYQEQLVDKILSEDALINNNSIRKGLYDLVNKRYNCTYSNHEWVLKFFEDMTKAQLSILDTYAKDTKMQENKYINENICSYVFKEGSYFQTLNAEKDIIQFLQDNADNEDKQIFDKFNDMLLSKGAVPYFIRKVLSNKLFYENESLYSVLREVHDTFAADDVIKILDIYEKEFSDSEIVSKNMGDIIMKVFGSINNLHSHYPDSENPYEERAKKIMQELVKEENSTVNRTGLNPSKTYKISVEL